MRAKNWWTRGIEHPAPHCVVVKIRKEAVWILDFAVWIVQILHKSRFSNRKYQTTPTRVGGQIRVQGTAKSLAPHRTHDEMIFTPIFQHFLIIQWGVRSAKHLPQMLRCWRWFAKLALFHGQSWSQWPGQKPFSMGEKWTLSKGRMRCFAKDYKPLVFEDLKICFLVFLMENVGFKSILLPALF